MRSTDVAFKLLLFSLFGFASSRRRTLPFPEDFVWGTSTSAYQIEGATSGYGRGPSQWDDFVRKPGTIQDNSTADITADHYHHFLDDVLLLKKLGEGINNEGVQFYNKLINALIRNGIEPMVTLYHWDLPLTLARRGGWMNKETVEHFEKYAKFCFRHFGDRVKMWVTINEPYIELNQGYCSRVQVFAPGFLQEHCSWAYYLGSYHLLLAHGYAVRAYKRLFQPFQHGRIGLCLFAAWYKPENHLNSVEQRGSDLLIENGFDLFLQPIFGRQGGFPKALRNAVGERLPTLTPKERKLLMGSSDFLGINYYYTMLARELKTKRTNITQTEEIFGVEEIQMPSKCKTHPDYQKLCKRKQVDIEDFHPDELVDVFRHIRMRYGNITMYVTENGRKDEPAEGDKDKSRIVYIHEHLKALLRAISEGSDVRGYYLWSLLDNFEWSFGYTAKFGLFSVDFNDPLRPRSSKRSSGWYANVTRTNRI